MDKIIIDIPKTLPLFGQISIVTSTGEFVGYLVVEKGAHSKIIIDPSSPYEAKELLSADIAQVEYKITRRTPVEHPAENAIGEEFIKWADEYYSPCEPSKLNQEDVLRKDIYDNFLECIGPARRSFYSPKSFKEKLIKYCERRGYSFKLRKKNGQDYFTVSIQ